jgi:hypothetical protein
MAKSVSDAGSELDAKFSMEDLPTGFNIVIESRGGSKYGPGGMPPLPAQAAQWQTPVADDEVDRLRGNINSRGEPHSCAQAIQWPTPAAQNWKGSSPASVTRADGKSRMDILHYRAERGFTRPDPVITPDVGYNPRITLRSRARCGLI